MAVPAAFEAHLFGKNARPQFVLFAEVDEPYARSFQLLDQLYLKIPAGYKALRWGKMGKRQKSGARWLSSGRKQT